MSKDRSRTLNDLLDRLNRAAQGTKVSMQDILREFGDQAISPFILVVALMMVSPLSAVPSTPTITGTIIIVMSIQALSGRKKIWLPRFLLKSQLKSRHVENAVTWLRKPCKFLDDHSQERLAFLTVGPMRYFTFLMCIIIPLGWPFLEILPMVTSFGAGTVALLIFGLLTRDGVYVMLGYLVIIFTFLAGLSFFA